LGAESAVCPECDKRLEERIVKLALWIGEELVLVEDVPASVCPGCGKRYFSTQVTEAIQGLWLTSLGNAGRKTEVPVFTLGELTRDKCYSERSGRSETDPESGKPGIDPGIYFYA